MWVVKKSKVHGTGVFATLNISKNKKIIPIKVKATIARG